MKKTLVRAAGVVFAGALITVAGAPAALAQDDTTSVTTTSESPTSTSETPTSTSATPTTTTTSSAPSSTSATTGGVATTDVAGPVQKVEKGGSPIEVEPAPEPAHKDNVGHGLVGLGGEGVLVIACAAGAPGNLATANLNVTGGPDQDGADGSLWNYTVRVASPPTGPTAPFSWTCAGVPGQGTVEFEQKPTPPTTTTTTTSTPTTSEPSTSSSAPASSTAPITTSTSAPGNPAPQAQVKVTPKGGVETGFGGMA